MKADMNFRMTLALGLILLPVGLSASTGMERPLDGVRITISGQRRYVTLRNLAAHYGLQRETLPGGALRLSNPYHHLEFVPNSRKAIVDGITVWMNAPVVQVWRTWGITEADAALVVDPFLRPDRHLAGKGSRLVMLDPGHGGHDRGAVGARSSEEKRLVLDIAQRARVHLVHDGFKVAMTRDNDRFIDLSERSRMAAERGADVFVSIHLNSAGNANARGSETYVLTAPGFPSTVEGKTGNPKSIAYLGNGFDGSNFLLGYHIQKSLVRSLMVPDRGVRHARFVVLREAPCPAVLVECGFLTDPDEEANLLSESYREKIAVAIAQGIRAYATEVTRARAAAE
jgi:N-acetylmuramoyl-L-alanine amidase